MARQFIHWKLILMASISLDCPHCLTTKVGFAGSQYMMLRPGGSTYIMLMQCPICGEGVIAKFTGLNFPSWAAGKSSFSGIERINTYPVIANTELPLHVPERICGFYSQAKDNVARKNWDAAGIMFRKTLDASLKTLDPGKKGTLFQRIDSLPTSLGLSDAMKESAHEIRRLGADAAHEDDPFSEQEVSAIQSFTELFLTYTFTLPGMLAARKSTITSSTD